MRIMVTGATGFIGSAFVKRALGEGHEIVAYVRDAKRADPLAELGARVVVGTIGDPNQIAAAARGSEVVLHAAAVPTHRAHPRALSWVNVAGTENAVNAAKHAGCTRFVLVSCADVTLVDDDRMHWNEDRHLLGHQLDAHARSKALAEELALAAGSPSFQVTAIRPAWVWGPGDTTTLPSLIREAREHGGMRLVGAGENLVATTYIDNLVDALLAAAVRASAAGAAYYVADNEMTEARELFAALSKAAGLPPPRSGAPIGIARVMAEVRKRFGRPGLSPTDVVKRGRSSGFDLAKATKELEWEPRVSAEDGMVALAKWIEAEGGADAVAKLERPIATEASVDDLVAAAGG